MDDAGLRLSEGWRGVIGDEWECEWKLRLDEIDCDCESLAETIDGGDMLN